MTCKRQTCCWLLFLVVVLLALVAGVEGQAAVEKDKRKKKFPFVPSFGNKRRSEAYVIQGENNKGKAEGENDAEEDAFCWRVHMLLPFLFWMVLQVGDILQHQDELVVDADSSSTANKNVSIDLAFDNLRLTLQKKKSKGKKSSNGDDASKDLRVILNGSIRGRARPSRLLAIMGPSGAGKSTILHALAGQIGENSKLKLSGNRYVNGVAVPGDEMLPSLALIEQDVNFFAHMTVRETLDFRVQLQFGSSKPRSERDALVDNLLAQLGLSHVQDSIVGGPRVRGISGGERKRLSIAVEMIISPSLIFLDEPTTGLDSTAAAALIQTLKELATKQNKTIVAVIHQPSQHVFGLFDDLLLVSQGGQQMYFGEVKKVRHYMEFDMDCKADIKGIGTAELVLDCISKQPSSPEETDDQVQKRIEKIRDAADTGKIDFGFIDDASPSTRKRSGLVVAPRHHGERRPRSNLLVQFRLLCQRSLREMVRGKTALLVNIVQQVSIAIIYGGIYNVGSNNQGSIQDRFGLLSLITIGTAQLALATTVKSFPREKDIVSKEMGAAKLYRTFPYFVGKALSEWPFVAAMNSLFGFLVCRFTGLAKGPGKLLRFIGLMTTHGLLSQANGLAIGSVSPSIEIALALMPVVSILTFIFDGRNVSVESTPWILRWVPKISLMRWGYEGFCLNEFDGLEFASPNLKERLAPRGPVMKTGSDALAQLGMDPTKTSVGQVVKAQLLITGACWLLSYIGLSATGQRFLVMDKPAPKEQTK